MSEALAGILLDLAAVSGTFDPGGLADAAGVPRSGALREAAWRILSSQATELLPGDEGAGGSYGWLLRPDARRARLAQFLTLPHLDQALALAPPPRAGDALGAALRTLLARGTPTVAEGPAGDEAALLEAMRRNAAIFDAVQLAAVVPALDPAPLAEIRRQAHHQVQLIQRRRDFAAVLPRRHRGYEAERRRLAAFLGGEGGADARPMLLTGLGGVGKSALLARILREWQGRPGAPVTVVLDLDRRQLNAGEPVEIVKELTRQVEAGLPQHLPDPAALAAATEGLSQLRRELPKFLADARRSNVSQLGYLASILPSALASDWAAPLRTLPIAAILDSFEALHHQDAGAAALVIELEALLRTAGLSGLRTVVSGRAEPLDAAGLLTRFGGAGRQLLLDGLSPAAGARLLADEDRRLAGPEGQPVLVSPDLRQRASEVLGGHPLALLIFARYARSHRDDIEALVQGLAEDGGFHAAFAQVFLYERILDRIDDPEVAALAHPGLVLRQLNADLLRLVLAGPCFGRGPADPQPMTEAEASALLERLRREYWLVEEAPPPFVLRHRADLRRMMLEGLFAGGGAGDDAEQARRKDDLKTRALAVAAAAAGYFRDGPGSGEPAAASRHAALDRGTREVEATYYNALARPDLPPDFDAEAAQQLALGLGEDVATLPLAWRARLGALLGRDLSEGETATLDPALRETVERDRFRRRIKTGSVGPVPTAGAEPPETVGPLSEDEHDLFLTMLSIRSAFDEARFGSILGDTATLIRIAGGRSEPLDAQSREALRATLSDSLLVAGTVPEGREALAAALDADREGLSGALLAALRGDAEGVRRHASGYLSGPSPTAVEQNRLHFATEAGDAARVLLAGLSLAAIGAADLGLPADPAAPATLGRIHGLYAGAAVSAVPVEVTLSGLGPGARIVLRGLSPELHAPLSAILNRLDPEPQSAALRELETSGIWPEELRGLWQRPWNPVQAPTVVETADQCGLLRHLAERLAAHDAGAATIVAMHDAITRWFYPSLAS